MTQEKIKKIKIDITKNKLYLILRLVEELIELNIQQERKTKLKNYKGLLNHLIIDSGDKLIYKLKKEMRDNKDGTETN